MNIKKGLIEKCNFISCTTKENQSKKKVLLTLIIAMNFISLIFYLSLKIKDMELDTEKISVQSKTERYEINKNLEINKSVDIIDFLSKKYTLKNINLNKQNLNFELEGDEESLKSFAKELEDKKVSIKNMTRDNDNKKYKISIEVYK